MRIIALINQKGGCGKTTCSINLAACLANLNQRTLLLDMDPQGHCAVGLAVPDGQIEKSVVDVLRDPAGSVTIKDIAWQIAAHFDLAPSNIALVALEQELHGVEGRQDRLADALERVQGDYDYCIIDCPPNVGLLTFNAMRASSEVIIPVETGYFSLHGLSKQLELMDALRKQCRQEIRVRILPTLYDIRTKLAREVLAELREQFGELMLESAINFNTKLKEAASFGQPITEYDPASKGFKDFQKLARELMGPAPRLALDLSSYLSQGDEAAEEAENVAPTLQIPTSRDSVDIIPEGIELIDEDEAAEATDAPGIRPVRGVEHLAAEAFDLSEENLTAAARATPDARPSRVGQEALRQVEQLQRKADELLALAQRDMGITISPEKARVSLADKLEEFYGVRQLPEGVLFVTRYPRAAHVQIAGDFNGWKPEKTRMQNGGEAGVFRALLPLTPGRYRYRLVVDGQWQADPNNVYTEPNEFGGVNSVVEVV